MPKSFSYPWRLSTLRPIFLHNILLVHFTHGIALNAIDQLEDRWDLIGCHFLLKLCTQALEFQRFRLFILVFKPFPTIFRELVTHPCSLLHNRGDTLTPFLIDQPNHCNLLDGLQSKHFPLHLQGRNLIASRFD